jgi:hypothetical protein
MVETRIDRQAAEFTRRASLAISDTSAGVSYEIYQAEDRPWFLLDVLKQLPGARDDPATADTARRADSRSRQVGPVVEESVVGPWTETLSSSGHGSGTVIVATRGLDAMDRLPSWASTSPHDEGADDERKGRRRPRRRSTHVVDTPFRDVASPNPSFLYRGARNVELAIHLSPEDPMTTADGLAIGVMIAKVAEAAKERKSPITFLQTPTSSPPDSYQGQAAEPSDLTMDETLSLTWQRARAPGIRFAAALPGGEAKARFRFFKDVASVAESAGGRVWIADNRGDRRGGIWLPANNMSTDKYSTWAHGLIDAPSVALSGVWPVTFVGAARVGTTYEITRYLADHRIPVVSATIGSIKDLAFIHLGLGLAKNVGDNLSFRGTAHETLKEIVWRVRRRRSEAKLDKAADYKGFCGRVVPIVPQSTMESARSAWAAWQMPHRPDALLGTLECLRRSLRHALPGERTPDGLSNDDLVAATNVEYIVCRRVETGELKGRCKLALPPEYVSHLSGSDSETATELCRQVEEHWRTALSREFRSSAVEVEFTWRERWLGRWATLLAGSMS